MSTLQKLNLIVANNHLMVEFIDIYYEIHSKSWCDAGEDHTKNWFEGACKPAKYIRSIKKFFHQKIPVEEKKNLSFKRWWIRTLLNTYLVVFLVVVFWVKMNKSFIENLLEILSSSSKIGEFADFVFFVARKNHVR